MSAEVDGVYVHFCVTNATLVFNPPSPRPASHHPLFAALRLPHWSQLLNVHLADHVPQPLPPSPTSC